LSGLHGRQRQQLHRRGGLKVATASVRWNRTAPLIVYGVEQSHGAFPVKPFPTA
jgi:hypothetical protein